MLSRTFHRSARKRSRRFAAAGNPQATAKMARMGEGTSPGAVYGSSRFIKEGEPFGPEAEVDGPRSLWARRCARAGTARRRRQEDSSLPRVRQVRSSARELGGRARGAAFLAASVLHGPANRGRGVGDGQQEVADALGGLPLGDANSRRRGRCEGGSGTLSRPYSPDCVEGSFSEHLASGAKKFARECVSRVVHPGRSGRGVMWRMRAPLY